MILRKSHKLALMSLCFLASNMSGCTGRLVEFQGLQCNLTCESYVVESATTPITFYLTFVNNGPEPVSLLANRIEWGHNLNVVAQKVDQNGGVRTLTSEDFMMSTVDFFHTDQQDVRTLQPGDKYVHTESILTDFGFGIVTILSQDDLSAYDAAPEGRYRIQAIFMGWPDDLYGEWNIDALSDETHSTLWDTPIISSAAEIRIE